MRTSSSIFNSVSLFNSDNSISDFLSEGDFWGTCNYWMGYVRKFTCQSARPFIQLFQPFRIQSACDCAMYVPNGIFDCILPLRALTSNLELSEIRDQCPVHLVLSTRWSDGHTDARMAWMEGFRFALMVFREASVSRSADALYFATLQRWWSCARCARKRDR